MNAVRISLLCLLLGLMAGGQAWATTYYVDFDGGSDGQAGTSPAAAWKHCPGGAGAGGVAAATSLSPGDTIIFKGGVHYRGTVPANWSGSSDNPIIYDGNTAGTFGSGRAIIDGAERLTGWTQCASADECGGNPNWEHIYKVQGPAGVTAWTANLYEDDQMLWVAQDPNPTDPFFYDDTGFFRPVPPSNITLTTITDAAYFTQTDPDYWDGAYVLVWSNPNVVRILHVTNFVPADHKIYFETLPSNGLYPDRDMYYSMANSIHKLDTPGEFVVDEATGTIYLWPLDETDLPSQEITVSVRTVGLSIYHRNYVTVQGFLIQKASGGLGQAHWADGQGINVNGGGSYRGIVLRDNEITRNRAMQRIGGIWLSDCDDATVEDNYVHHNVGNRGMMLLSSDNVTVHRNLLDKNGGTSVYFGGCTNSRMTENTVLRHNGAHANGLTVYQNSNNVLISRNTVIDSNIALTTEQSSNLTVTYNVLIATTATIAYANWSTSDSIAIYNNVMLQPYDGKAALTLIGTTNTTIRNNILAGGGTGPGDHCTHNIYTRLCWNQYDRYGWYLGVGESIVTDLGAIFVDAANHDYRLKVGSPAIDAGIDVGLTEDHEGNPVPWGAGPDIGAYEYGSTVQSVAAWNALASHGGADLAPEMGEGYVESRLSGLGAFQVSFLSALDPATVGTGAVTIVGDASGDVSYLVTGATLDPGGTVLTLTLSSPLASGDWYTLTLSDALRTAGGAPLGGDVDLRVGVLAGDVDGSGAVTAADLLGVRAQAGQGLSAETARYDVDRSGQITGADLISVRARLGAELP